MDFVLEIRPPDGEFHYILLPDYGRITVGREPPADLVIPDRFLSRLHFQIDFGSGFFVITDVGSSNGTLVNGVRLKQSEVRHGDGIYVGRTALRIGAVMNDKPALAVLPESPGTFLPWEINLLSLLEEQCNFVILDGAISPAVRNLLTLSGMFYQSLYEGEGAAEIAPYGPFLVALTKGCKLTPFLVKSAWGKSWGIFARAELTFEEMRKHLRHFLVVNTEDGQSLLFRFYDPRTLRTFLPSCDESQRKEFFGPIQSFIAELDEIGSAALFSLQGREVRRLE